MIDLLPICNMLENINETLGEIRAALEQRPALSRRDNVAIGCLATFNGDEYDSCGSNKETRMAHDAQVMADALIDQLDATGAKPK